MPSITDLTLDGGSYEISAGKLEGTYESDPQDGGSVKVRWWSINFTNRALETRTVDNLGGLEVGSGEAHARLIDGRDASPWRPGADFSRTVDEVPGTIDSASLAVCGPAGSIGAAYRFRVQAAFSNDDVAYSDWEDFREGWREARYIKTLITMSRLSFDWQVYLDGLIISSSISDYLTQAEGDARYYTKGQVNSLFLVYDSDADGIMDKAEQLEGPVLTQNISTAAQVRTHLDATAPHSNHRQKVFTLSGAGKELMDLCGKDPTGSQTGALVLDLGQSSFGDGVTIDLGGYQDATGGHWRAICGGWESGTWSYDTCYLIGNPPFDSVRFGYMPGGNACIVFGEITDGWTWPSVFVRACNASYSPSIVATGWALTFVSSLTSYTLKPAVDCRKMVYSEAGSVTIPETTTVKDLVIGGAGSVTVGGTPGLDDVYTIAVGDEMTIAKGLITGIVTP